MIPLDTEENQILTGISGVIVKHDICFEHRPQWSVKDQIYEIKNFIDCSKTISRVKFNSENLRTTLVWVKENGHSVLSPVEWKNLKAEYGFTKTEALGEKMETFEKCPQSPSQLGDVWIPLSKDLDIPIVWTAYINDANIKGLGFDIECYRRGITADHPFIVWLLQNAIHLRQNFQWQFQQIIESFCKKDAKDIVQMYDVIREQIYLSSNRYNMDVKSLPQLALTDFWTDKKECPF